MKGTESVIEPYKNPDNENSSRFLTETLRARRTRTDVVQAWQDNYYQPRLLDPAKLSFKIDGEIQRKTLVQQTLQEFMNTIQAEQRTLEEFYTLGGK